MLHPSLTAAAKLNDRLLLHLNMPINEIRHLLVYYIPGMVLLFGLLNLISRLMLYRRPTNWWRSLPRCSTC